MIISSIVGGLGNQMFQYAVARAVTLERGVPLLLDTTAFDHYRLHQGFELGRLFDCQAAIASPEDVRRVLGWLTAGRFARRILQQPTLRRWRPKEMVVEPHFHYWPGINSIPSRAHLSGYWQSERYFLKIGDRLRADFRFKQALDVQNQELASRISSSNAVSIHVRRGDYNHNPHTRRVHGLCSVEYYQNAIRFVAGKVTNPHFFFFSDDPDWVREHITTPHFACDYVSHNTGTESYNDMRLMSLCRHHVIANSSFSWWGAWLNPRADKIVVAPRNWFASGRQNTDDLYPAAWTRS